MSFEATDPDGTCDCCHYGPTPVRRTDPGPMSRSREVDMCRVCYGSLTGVWATYSDVHDRTKVELGKLLAWGINHIRDAVVAAVREGMKP